MRTLLVLAVLAALVVVAYAVLRADGDQPPKAAASVTLVGDSLNVGTDPYLRKELAGWKVDVNDRVGRSTAEGVEELGRRARELAPIVVISLGTIDADGSERRFRSLVAEAIRLVGDETCLVWATIVRDGAARAGFNDALVDARRRHANLRLVEWAALTETDDALLAADRVHGTGDGYARRAEETARVVRTCRRG
jgi:lysophospholipase L1-like esterase